MSTIQLTSATGLFTFVGKLTVPSALSLPFAFNAAVSFRLQRRAGGARICRGVSAELWIVMGDSSEEALAHSSAQACAFRSWLAAPDHLWKATDPAGERPFGGISLSAASRNSFPKSEFLEYAVKKLLQLRRYRAVASPSPRGS